MSATINAANFLMLSVFGIAAVGYLLGRITIKGISLGTACLLYTSDAADDAFRV